MKVYPMRRKDKQAGEEDILRILKENVYGVLSTSSEDGWPLRRPRLLRLRRRENLLPQRDDGT